MEGRTSSSQFDDPSTVRDLVQINPDNDNCLLGIVDILGKQITKLRDSGAHYSILKGDEVMMAHELSLQKNAEVGGIKTTDGAEHCIQSCIR